MLIKKNLLLNKLIFFYYLFTNYQDEKLVKGFCCITFFFSSTAFVSLSRSAFARLIPFLASGLIYLPTPAEYAFGFLIVPSLRLFFSSRK